MLGDKDDAVAHGVFFTTERHGPRHGRDATAGPDERSKNQVQEGRAVRWPKAKLGAVLASVGAHAVAFAAMSRAPGLERRPLTVTAPFDLQVTAPRAPPPEPPTLAVPVPVRPDRERPVRPPVAKTPRSVATSEPQREAPSSSSSSSSSAGPAAKSLGMRRPDTARVPEVQVPRPWEIGKPEGPPAADQLSPEALGAPIRPPDLPGPLYRTGVPGQAERLGENVVADGDGGYREDHTTFKARVDRDGAVHFNDRGNLQVDSVTPLPLFIFMGGHFDITDKLMMMHGEDPYRYEKAKFMERTRDERADMGLAARSERLGAAIARMPKYLDRIWRDEAWPAAERKLAIFSLWEEVAEDGDDELVSIGAKVRWEICSFIRRRLPVGSAQAYTREELDALNARRKCKSRFDPYTER